MKIKHTVFIKNEQKDVPLTPSLRAGIKSAVNATLAYEAYPQPTEVSVTLTDDTEIRELNREYREHDCATDVLSFPLGDEYEGRIILGDIVISAQHAAEQAVPLGNTTEREIEFLCIHSTLHLLGYDHETSDEDAEEMYAKQREIREKIDAAVKKSHTGDGEKK